MTWGNREFIDYTDNIQFEFICYVVNEQSKHVKYKLSKYC
jgi:hypothetical protein